MLKYNQFAISKLTLAICYRFNCLGLTEIRQIENYYLY